MVKATLISLTLILSSSAYADGRNSVILVPVSMTEYYTAFDPSEIDVIPQASGSLRINLQHRDRETPTFIFEMQRANRNAEITHKEREETLRLAEALRDFLVQKADEGKKLAIHSRSERTLLMGVTPENLNTKLSGNHGIRDAAEVMKMLEMAKQRLRDFTDEPDEIQTIPIEFRPLHQ